jgi:poly(A) polymerase
MEPALTLNPVPAWMAAGPGARVIAALGGAERALYVGGCVRAAVARPGQAPKDIDIATRLEPGDAMRALKAAGMGAVPTGLAHGTVTAVADGAHAEVTTLRRDVSTDGRRATVAFTRDWGQDAARRDFTMNALYAGPDGRVYDPLGRGAADALAGRVVFVGDAATRIAEDRLRVLRFFRMHAFWGRGAPDGEALAACAAAADTLGALSRERVTGEVTRMLMHPAPAAGLELMWSCGVLTALRGARYDGAALDRLAALQAAHGAEDLAARLVALGAPVEGILRLPRRVERAVAALADMAPGPAIDTPRAARAAVYRHGREHAAQAALLQAAAGRVDDGALPAVLEVARAWPVPRFPLSGHALIARGVPPGPALGRALAAAEAAWIASDFTEAP